MKVVVVGLGYVGLPLALAFGLRPELEVYGYDTSALRIMQLIDGKDKNNEFAAADLLYSTVQFIAEESQLPKADVVIVSVPTGLDHKLNPDYSHLKEASSLAGRIVASKGLVVYESTVHPGTTEEI